VTLDEYANRSGNVRDAWDHARGDAVAAYRHWTRANDTDRGRAYAVYVAALDREDAAATAYAAAMGPRRRPKAYGDQ
jgi:hypothetical protein